MSQLRAIVDAVNSTDGSTAMPYKKGEHTVGEGYQYEDHVLALVFLRCLKERLIFQLSANNGEAGKCDDLVLVWRPEGHPEARILCVQLKHKESTTIQCSALLSESHKCDFGLRRYCTSYEEISKLLEMDKVTHILMTDACVSHSCLKILENQNVGSVSGLDLLQAGGTVYRLKQDDQQVCEAVCGNINFLNNFYLLCEQDDPDRIVSLIHKELDDLLGAGDKCEYICDRLCKRLRKWKKVRQRVCLTRSWSEWQKLVDEYVKKKLTCRKEVTTRLKYCCVTDVREYMESSNPAWVRPPENGTEALSATKIYKALAHETHIIVAAERFRKRRQRILRCWGPYCRWLVIVDNDKEDNSGIFDELVNEIQTERRLVIVSSRENNSFIDTCHSSDISDKSWNKFLNISVLLNGDRYECHLRDLVAGVDALKSLLDGQPALLLALARLSQPLRMGRELEPLPTYHITRKLYQWQVTDEFWRSLGFRDVCVTNRKSYNSLSLQIGNHSVMNLVDMRYRFPTQSRIDWPIFVLTEHLESVQEEYKHWGSLNIYVLQTSDERQKIISLSKVSVKSRGSKAEQEKEQLEVLDTASNMVIVEGRPGVGKSIMLSDVAKQIKERDSACWILRVNLSEFYRVLDINESGVTAMEDILKRMLFNKDLLHGLEYTLLRHSLQKSTQVVCLVDGFEDVCPDYVDKCLEVLLLLSPHEGKLVVTTRPALVRALEARMGVLAHSLEPFSKSDPENFFTRHPLSGSIPPISGLNRHLRDLLRFPLFAEMFAKHSQEKADVNDIVTLYEAFVRNLFRMVYEEKRGDNFSAPGKKEEVEEAQKQHEEQLMLLAASVMLPSKTLPANPTFNTDYFVKSGIVYDFINGKPVFLHRTFTEYFFAKWCLLRGGEEIRATVYRKAYVSKKLEFFLQCFDRMAVRGRPLLEATLDGDEGKVRALLDQGSDPTQAGACGRRVLHVAAASCTQRSLGVLRLLCKRAGKDALFAKDSLLGWTPMRYAAEGKRWAAVNALLEEGADLSQLGDFRPTVHYPKQLQAVFKQGGYRALWQHVLHLNNPSRKADAAWQGADTQTEFALSLISTNLPREWLRVIAEKAREEGHHTVASIISCWNRRRAGKEMPLPEKENKLKPK